MQTYIDCLKQNKKHLRFVKLTKNVVKPVAAQVVNVFRKLFNGKLMLKSGMKNKLLMFHVYRKSGTMIPG